MYRQDHSEMRWSTNGDVIERLTVSVIFAVLIAYVASRAALMSITHDEALTYVWHVKGSVTDIVSFSTLGLADNNHMLFTLLAKASTIAFGPSELALRLPSVIAYAGFLAALYLTLRLFVQGVVLWLFFLFVAINPYVIDMFSIARGYGLGMALGTAGLYLFLSAVEDKESSAWKPVLAGALFALAALAHLVMLLLFIAFLGLRVLAAAGAFMRGVFWRRRVAVEAIGLASVAGLLVAASIEPFLKISDRPRPLDLWRHDRRSLTEQSILSSRVRCGMVIRPPWWASSYAPLWRLLSFCWQLRRAPLCSSEDCLGSRWSPVFSSRFA